MSIYSDFNGLSLIKSLKWIADKLGGKFKWVALYNLTSYLALTKSNKPIYILYIGEWLRLYFKHTNIFIFKVIICDENHIHFYHNVLNVL